MIVDCLADCPTGCPGKSLMTCSHWPSRHWQENLPLDVMEQKAAAEEGLISEPNPLLHLCIRRWAKDWRRAEG